MKQKEKNFYDEASKQVKQAKEERRAKGISTQNQILQGKYYIISLLS